MINHDLERQVKKLERLFDAAPTQERLRVAPDIKRIAIKLDTRHEPIPRPLRRIQKALEQDVFDDMFDNMPV